MVIDPGMWGEPEIRAALAVRDMGVVYRALRDLGVSQSQIAAWVGQAQSEVSEIIAGRVVQNYGLLERIAEGLGIPRELMGLSWYGPDGSSVYPGSTTTAEPPEGVDEPGNWPGWHGRWPQPGHSGPGGAACQ